MWFRSIVVLCVWVFLAPAAMAQYRSLAPPAPPAAPSTFSPYQFRPLAPSMPRRPIRQWSPPPADGGPYSHQNLMQQQRRRQQQMQRHQEHMDALRSQEKAVRCAQMGSSWQWSDCH